MRSGLDAHHYKKIAHCFDFRETTNRDRWQAYDHSDGSGAWWYHPQALDKRLWAALGT